MKIGRSLRYVSHTSPYTIFDIILDPLAELKR